MHKVVVITGASGFFGRSLIESLLSFKDDFKVICIYHASHYKVDDPRFIWVQADILNGGIGPIIERYEPSLLYHLAWYVEAGKFWDNILNIAWLKASIDLFIKFCEHKGQCFVGAGTLAEYDQDAVRLDEKVTKLEPATLYGQCKLSAFQLMSALQGSHYRDVSIVWPRIGYFFGEHDSPKKFIKTMITNINNKKDINLVNSAQKIPYTHVKYAGQALAKIYTSPHKNIVFNLSSNKNIGLFEIIKFLAQCLDNKNIVIKCHFNHNHMTKNTEVDVSNTVMREEIGFSIPDTFFLDLKEMINHVN